MLYVMRNIWRLHRKCFSSRNNHLRTPESEKQFQNKDFKRLLQEHKDKITFNSYLEHEKLRLGNFKYHLKTIKKAKKTEIKEFAKRSLPPLPLSLKYYVDKERLLDDEIVTQVEEPPKTFQLPFASTTHVDIQQVDVNAKEPSNVDDAEFDRSNIQKWMTNYEHFDDTKALSVEEDSDDEVENDWCKHYGTPDPNEAISQVRCCGCGALLHCSDAAIPGYLPSELFKGREIEELKTMECQRCHFLQEYNIAMDVTVQPEEYVKLLKSIRHVKSLVLLMVDLVDFPCSIWPGIVDIIGKDRPIFIVANKVDLLPGDSIGYLPRIKESLLSEIKKTKLSEANIKYVALVSAKTGYGVEQLISAMFKLWQYKGDVFLVGCTNVGKSSLFNALLQSDYCKVHAVDIVKRATVSAWPGTTLNLLKFPINRPTGWKIRERSKRLFTKAKLLKVEEEIRKEQVLGGKTVDAPSLMCHIGRTFTDPALLGDQPVQKPFTVLDENHELFRKSKWFYDTPGVVHPDQVLSLLSTEELLLTIPKKLITPQSYYMDKGATLFVGGLARIDLVDCTEPCRVSIFCSENLPITLVNTSNADELYEAFVGTELFAVPSGGHDRLRNWPGLKSNGTQYEFAGEGPKFCCGDIVLSSIGWVSMTVKRGSRCSVAAWTPEGRGVHKRYPSVLPYSINLKGKRVQGTPAYMVGKVYDGEK